ncbi:MAG: signal peptidase I [Eubacteriales bacterium]|nr:signal peptidase I [Eubacteriales bacterium]
MAGYHDVKRFKEKYKLYIAAGITAWVILFFVHPIGIHGDAMAPTLEDGQIVLVLKQTYKKEAPPLYEVVNFNRDFSKEGAAGENEVRRVVGLPGDTIEIKAGIVYRNGDPIKEQYANIGTAENMSLLTIEEGKIFVLGDSPKNGIDSRTVGPLEMKDLRGDCRWILWPLQSFGAVE